MLFKYILNKKYNKDITIDEWRNNRLHRKCRFCIHGCHHSVHLMDLTKTKKKGYIVCDVKDNYVHNDIPRPFCTMFNLKTRNKED